MDSLFFVASGISGIGVLATYVLLALLFWRLKVGVGWAVVAFVVPAVITLGSWIGGAAMIAQGYLTPGEYQFLISLAGLVLPVFLLILLLRVWSRNSTDDVFQ